MSACLVFVQYGASADTGRDEGGGSVGFFSGGCGVGGSSRVWAIRADMHAVRFCSGGDK